MSKKRKTKQQKMNALKRREIVTSLPTAPSVQLSINPEEIKAPVVKKDPVISSNSSSENLIVHDLKNSMIATLAIGIITVGAKLAVTVSLK